MAVSSGRVAVVRKLLELGASPTIRDNTNSTCLHLAARACAPSMVAALLEKEEMRLDVDALDDDNRTALMLVAMYDMVDTKIAEMLCDAGAQVNCDGDNSLTTWRGRTALHFAAKYNNPRVVAFLLEKNANKDCQDYECCTPLHLAASENHVEPAKELLKVGASVMLRNDKYQTPYDTALVNNSKDVAALLVSGDNLRVQLYSNNGEIFASSSSPSFKCAKVLMARHMRNSRGPHSSMNSPKSTQSTPTRCSVSSPYNHSSTPHSVAAFGSKKKELTRHLSIQIPSRISWKVPFRLHSVSSHQAVIMETSPRPPDEISSSTICTERGIFIRSLKRETRLYYAFHAQVLASPGFFDSGLATMTDRSSYDHSGPWSGNEGFSKLKERIESAHEWVICSDGYIV
ncbi:ankyrin repeat protein [Cooperia oncophora]